MRTPEEEAADAEAMKEIMLSPGAVVCVLGMDYGASELRTMAAMLDAGKVVIIGHPDQLSPTGRIIDHKLRVVEIGNRLHAEAEAFIRSIDVEHSVRRSNKTAMMAQVLIACMGHQEIPMFEINDSSWLRGMALDRPNPDTWSNDQKSRKLPKPSFKHQKNVFRTTMRSVNRNR